MEVWHRIRKCDLVTCSWDKTWKHTAAIKIYYSLACASPTGQHGTLAHLSCLTCHTLSLYSYNPLHTYACYMPKTPIWIYFDVLKELPWKIDPPRLHLVYQLSYFPPAADYRGTDPKQTLDLKYRENFLTQQNNRNPLHSQIKICQKSWVHEYVSLYYIDWLITLQAHTYSDPGNRWWSRWKLCRCITRKGRLRSDTIRSR